ncbi:hypothetical protein [Sphingomonas abietis]|uniref:Secreted protein n=1 Tax=Sphingomonas abietis TaxID=3012344 RepID=A0ABY7NLP5_9SPHN|nr:hypothetical protein [Sphingomonas abietis]WBO21890.1 hypothetical protein PBT88_17240 [Sphingomonas abietis]
MLTTTFLCAALSIAAVSSAAAAAEPQRIDRTAGAVIRYDEPTGRYCIAFDAVSGVRPPYVACKPMKAWTDIGIMVVRR